MRAILVIFLAHFGIPRKSRKSGRLPQLEFDNISEAAIDYLENIGPRSNDRNGSSRDSSPLIGTVASSRSPSSRCAVAVYPVETFRDVGICPSNSYASLLLLWVLVRIRNPYFQHLQALHESFEAPLFPWRSS